MVMSKKTPLICLYFQAHQPYRLNEYDFFKLGSGQNYLNNELNEQILREVSRKSYQPANRLFQDILEDYSDRFAVSYSLSGVFIEQLRDWSPETLESFQQLAASPRVELLGETYYHSLACLSNEEEFTFQVEKHKRMVKKHFGVEPETFRNTELIFSNQVAKLAEEMGYKNIIFEGLDSQKAQNKLTLRRPATTKNITAIPRSLSYSDDVAFRFSDQSWNEHPLTAEKFVNWIQNSEEDFINIFIDYESLGEHQDEVSGIFKFWDAWIRLALDEGLRFVTPSQLSKEIAHRDAIDCHEATSWADTAKDVSAWRGNVMQKEALDKMIRLKPTVYGQKNQHYWRKLLSSDHFYYMSTKSGTDGDVHSYFSPYGSPYDAYIYFMNILADFQIQLKENALERVNAQALVVR